MAIRHMQAGVVHCPSSNFNLCSGVANVRRYLTEGIKVSVSVCWRFAKQYSAVLIISACYFGHGAYTILAYLVHFMLFSLVGC